MLAALIALWSLSPLQKTRDLLVLLQEDLVLSVLLVQPGHCVAAK